MTAALKYRLKGPSEDYLALVREFPLYPIRTGDEYDAAAAVLDRLVMKDEKELTEGEAQYLEALELLIEDYDKKHFGEPADARTPIERLKYLMDQSGVTVTQMGKILGSQPLASLILHGKRNLTLTHIRKLAEYFKVEAAYFV